MNVHMNVHAETHTRDLLFYEGMLYSPMSAQSASHQMKNCVSPPKGGFAFLPLREPALYALCLFANTLARRPFTRMMPIPMADTHCTQAVILAAGLGTRMRPLTLERPKPLIEVAGKPLIEHTLGMLPDSITDVVVVVGYLGDQIREYLGEQHGRFSITYAEQGPLQSTGGALVSALGELQERFLVCNADDIHGTNSIERMFERELCLLATETDTPKLYGVLTLHDDATLKGIEEKPEHPQTNLVNTGVMLLDQRIFTYNVPLVGDELRLTDMVTALAAETPVHVETQTQFCSVGYPEDIPVAEQKLLDWSA
jgi:NDP-sugar pyrophosphorylase family protein